MTVTNPTVIYTYPANGATTTFPYPQCFIAQTDLRVRLLDANDAAIAPPPVLNGGATYDYHITGTPDPTTGTYPAGGAIVFNNAPGAPVAAIQIARIVPITQPVALIDDAAIPASTVNLEFDRLTMIAQQLDAGLFTQSGDLPPNASPDYAGMVPVVLPDGSGYEMRTALLISPSDPTAFDATGCRIEGLAAPVAASDAATKGSADAGDAAALASGKGYADAGDAATLTSAKSYADAGDAATLTSAKNFATAGDTATLISAKSYADAGDATTLTSSKSYTDAKVSGTGSVPAPGAGDVGNPLTPTAAGAYSWQPINANNIGSGTLSAARLNLGTRLGANGTQLNALGPLTSFNAQAAAVNTAVDGALNYTSNGSGTYEWDLPVPALGMCIGIYLSGAYTGTIRPSAGVVISAPGGTSYTNAAPIIVRPGPLVEGSQIVLFCSRLTAWDILSVSSNVAEAMGWVSRPCLVTAFNGANLNPVGGTWTKINMDTIGSDSHGGWDATNHRYTPQRAGRYRITWMATIGDSATSHCISAAAAIYRTGALWVASGFSWNGTNPLPNQNLVLLDKILNLNGTTDYVEPYVNISATTPTFYGNGSSNFDVAYVGP